MAKKKKNSVYVLLAQPWDFDQSDCIEDQLCGTFTDSDTAIQEGIKKAEEGASEGVKAEVVHVKEKWHILIDDETCYIVVESTPA